MAQLTFGSCYWSSTAGTTLSANTPAKAAGTTTALENSGFTHTSNRLTYTGTVTRTFEVLATVSMSSGGATNSIVYIAKNGTVISGSAVKRKISTGGDIGAIACCATTQLAEDDYVEVFLENDDGDTMTVEAGVLKATVIG